MKSVVNFASARPTSINLTPLNSDENVCGNCSNWKGPRERNGRKSFICMDGAKGTCNLKMKGRDAASISDALTSPVSNGDCQHLKLVA